jgi:hypothetical protein
MADDDVRDQISRLEGEIEELAESTERCRKFVLASKLAIVAGGLLLLALVVGAIRFDPAAMILAIAAIMGGIVGFGSNTSTARQNIDAMRAAEQRRAELIGQIGLRSIDQDVSASTLLHSRRALH